MATVDPPPTIARIVEVLDPGGEYYVVYVRIPPHLASKFPDKPWGVRIEDIGLAEKDVVKFAGYTLVDFENISDRRVGDTADLFWVFQKLPGPIWTTKTKGQDGLIPQKYRRLVTTTQSKQEVGPATLPDDPSAAQWLDPPDNTVPNPDYVANLTQSVVKQQEDSGKAVKLNTEEAINANEEPLIGELTDTWGINTTEESLVTEGDSVDSGFGVKSSRVVPLGDGKSIKETERYPADDDEPPDGIIYTLEEEDTDDLTGVPIAIQKSLVDASQSQSIAASLRGGGWFTEIKALDKWHSIVVASKLDASILDVEQTWTETRDISLPKILDEIGVIWDADSDGSAGASGVENISDIVSENIGWQVESEANASAVVTGRPYTKIRQGYSGPAEVTVTRTFHFGPPTETITPYDFGEVYGTLTIYGAQKTQVAKAAKSGKGDVGIASSVFIRSHQDNNMAIHFFGPVVHSSVTLTHLGDSPLVTEIRTAIGGSTPGGGSYPTATANASISGTAGLSIPQSAAPLESGDTFIYSVNPSYYKLGYWVKEVRTAKVP